MRDIDFRVNVLRNGCKVTELDILSAPSVQVDAYSEIKATMSGEFYPNEIVDWLSDEIQPIAIIDGIEYSYGIYSPATYEIDYDVKTVRVEAYDRCWKVKGMTSAERIYFPSGMNYIDAITTLLSQSGIALAIVTPSNLAFPSPREDWDIGTAYLTIINTLLEEISYNPLWFNEQGYAVISPKSDLSVNPKREYNFHNIKTLAQTASATVDMFDVPNVFIAVCDNPDRTSVWTATAENNNPVSPTSIIRRGKRITTVIKVNNIASLSELQNYVNKTAYQKMMLGEVVSVATGILPYCGVNDTVALNHPDIYGVCRETAWTVTLAIDGEMVHQLETTALNVPSKISADDNSIAVAGIAIAGLAIAGRSVA